MIHAAVESGNGLLVLGAPALRTMSRIRWKIELRISLTAALTKFGTGVIRATEEEVFSVSRRLYFSRNRAL